MTLGGKGYSAETLALVFDVINICNAIEQRGIRKAKSISFIKKQSGQEIEITDDKTGDATVDVLKKTRKVLFRITTGHASSLGLHPAVYFYSITGRYQITSFLSMLELIKEMEIQNTFENFFTVRRRLESFLIRYKIFVNQTTVKYGSGLKGYKQLKKLYGTVITSISQDLSFEQIIDQLKKSEEYSYLNPNENEVELTDRKEFSTDTKSAVFLTNLLKGGLRCELCGGFIHINSSSIDHVERKENGGKGNFENASLTHPYCNTTHKN